MGGMTVFRRGRPEKRLYKKFTIKDQAAPDDYAAMEQMLTRRLTHYREAAETGKKDGFEILLHEKYPQTRLLLTAGSAGSYYLGAERRLFVPCEKVQAVDTTAAGDTYSGYFLAGLCSGSSVEDAMRLATKAAGIAVQRKGAAASIPEIKELK